MRKITGSHPAVVEPLSSEDVFETGLQAWCESVAGKFSARWLLAHADDGVIWGRFDGGKFTSSYDAARNHPSAKFVCAEFRIETLHQARIFGESAEILLWRDGLGAWKARVIRDEQHSDSTGQDGETAGNRRFVESFDEPQLLWGTTTEQLELNFTLLSDGEQGLRHAIPIPIGKDDKKIKNALLHVRHYLENTDITRIAASRLLSISLEVMK